MAREKRAQILHLTDRQKTPFAFAVVMMGLYTSTRFGMAEPVTDEVENLIGRKPISFQQYVMDYKESWS